MNNSQFWIDHFSIPEAELLKTFLDLKIEDFPHILEEHHLTSVEGESFESAENRVFGFGDVIIKFYRPGRWTLEALKEEVQFLKDLEEAKVSAVRALGEVKTWKGIHYLAYQKIEEPFEESPAVFKDEMVKDLSHLLAKVHEVGAKREATHRSQFDPSSMCEGCFEVIQKAGFLPKDMQARYQGLLEIIIKNLNEFKDIPKQRVHGDAYSGNIVWKSGKPVILDFDDFQVGPRAMDLKLLSFPWRLDSLDETMDRKERREIQQQLVLKYYREKLDFPKSWERVFPMMSAYRDIQFDAWFSARWHDPGFSQAYSDDDITQAAWWKDNMDGLEGLLNNFI